MGSILSNLDAATLLHSFGPWVLVGIGVVVFIETGLLFPFLPGDSLIVTAAALHAQLGLQVWQLILVACAAAIAGDQFSFWLGRRFGRGLFKPDARVLKSEYLLEAENFFERWGALSLVLGRFVPIVRTYVPVAAGTANMRYRHFAVWNILGAISWVVLMTIVGVALGQIPGITKSIDGIMLLIILVSVLPIIIGWLVKRHKAKIAANDEAVVALEDTQLSADDEV